MIRFASQKCEGFKNDVKVIAKLFENYCNKYMAASILSRLAAVLITESILHLFLHYFFNK